MTSSKSMSVFFIKSAKKREKEGCSSRRLSLNMSSWLLERGSKDGVCKMKTLQGRWFSKSVKKDDKKMKTMQIEQGSIVRLFSDRTFLVYIVWRVDGCSKKWFPSVIGDNPSSPVVQADLKKYRLGVREVTAYEGGEAFAYKQYDCDARMNGGGAC
jgi:hypothetical protein